ncbi:MULTISPECIES: hemerythrin domain-containing protein [Nitratireductor]|uniref:hemerythrin domain-containing protein n=1 Tax=Nitratireductor TaxID=245876 RepID=UPI0019D33A8B|nr:MULTISPECIES: hemerythrin domain-containing protein [Nitratireductor]MBN7778209.1 hemerythrin domain-containing protein [Nitratireductor pacificus]MBN7782531.1 hemerythrin domain-containing protein [Nitratireductor pacificus]MBN7791338.1 hemerythrin domain-containing protein [Nitratireductor aquimarinus]MBY6100418.1 hemerythrin domain-containing protein [Nitratireductor aquimarinus]MCA1261050.1 hemerythrin domain-containing protein [Nitratireductor aquimarinus]
MTELPETLRLDTRPGLPADLRYLVEKYPREVWPTHPNLGEMAQFWLQRHDMFRELGGMLKTSMGDYREGRLAPREFAGWFAPRLRFFLQQLNGHHQIEDMHYFPVFAAAEARMKHGFDLLDSDHHVIHDALERNAQAGTAFLQALQADQDRQRFAADAYARENEALLAMLLRHLDDEEDLIIPLILDRSEEGLGVSL